MTLRRVMLEFCGVGEYLQWCTLTFVVEVAAGIWGIWVTTYSDPSSSDGKKEHKIDKHIVQVAAVLQSLYWSVVVKQMFRSLCTAQSIIVCGGSQSKDSATLNSSGDRSNEFGTLDI